MKSWWKQLAAVGVTAKIQQVDLFRPSDVYSDRNYEATVVGFDAATDRFRNASAPHQHL